MIINGYEIIGTWKTVATGMVAEAVKDGNRYLLKKYTTVIAPIHNEIHEQLFDAKTLAYKQKQFDEFVERRMTMNARLREIDGSMECLFVPCDEFVDGVFYVEVCKKIDNILSYDDVMRDMPALILANSKMIMMVLAGTLAGLHKRGIVYGAISRNDVVFFKNNSGIYLPKLINPESAFEVNNIPRVIASDSYYYAPEVSIYSTIDEPEQIEESKRFITEKADIFSLGLLYHLYLSGQFPMYTLLPESLQKRYDDPRSIPPCDVLIGGSTLRVSPKITNPSYASLITDMLSLDPSDRPTATEVLARIRDTDTVRSISEEPKASSFKVECEEMWPEYEDIEFDVDRLISRGFISIEKVILNGIHCFKLCRANGTSQVMRMEMMLLLKFAKKK